VALQQLHVDVRLAAAPALEEPRGGELHQVAKALVTGREQGEVVALPPDLIAPAVVDVVGLEPEDRLDPVLAAGLVVLDRPVHDAVVREAEGRLPICGGPLGEGIDLAGAIEQRVLGVDVEVGGGRRHGGQYRSGIGPHRWAPRGFPAASWMDGCATGYTSPR
jgi:hypothetical protein